MRPGKGRKYVLKVLDEVIKCRPRSRGTDISSAADFMQRVMKKRSVVFVISDFIDTKNDYMTRLRVMSRKHDVITGTGI